MYLTTEVKKNILSKHGKSTVDTGLSEGQIALFTHRIQHLSEHMKQNKKDMRTKRSLVGLVGQRRKLLDYLKERDITRYRAILKELNLRK
ncbi:MAG: 30S ribosomal protein S15 [Bacteroidales bacterium]|nr:30S ribosomal protein S15 [Bacteroidales bacterium]